MNVLSCALSTDTLKSSETLQNKKLSKLVRYSNRDFRDFAKKFFQKISSRFFGFSTFFKNKLPCPNHVREDLGKKEQHITGQ